MGAAVLVDVRVLHDAVQPCLGIGTGLELIEEPVGLHIRILQQIAGLLAVAGEIRRIVEQLVHVRHHLLLETAMPDAGLVSVYLRGALHGIPQ